MTSIDSVTLQVSDPDAAERFYATAFGLGQQLQVQAVEEPSSGFRGFTLSLIVSQPSTVSSLFTNAIEAGGTALKPVEKSLWGYGGVVQAPDGAIWKIATSAKKDSGPATKHIDQIALLLAASDVAESKRYYLERGFTVAKSFGKYVEFDAPEDSIKCALYGRRALAKDAGVSAEGEGSHRLLIKSSAGQFTDPDGFNWVA